MPKKKVLPLGYKKVVINNESHLDVRQFPTLKRKASTNCHGKGKRHSESIASTNEPKGIASAADPVVVKESSNEPIEDPPLSSISGSSSFPCGPTTIIIERNELNTYIHLLITQKGFTPVGYDFRTFVLKSFNGTTKMLEDNKFFVVSRSARKFLEATQWVYACSCDEERSAIVKALSQRVKESHEDFRSRFPECLHISVLRQTMECFDEKENICPTVAEDHSYSHLQDSHINKVSGIYEVSWDGSSFCAFDGESYGVCTVKKGQFVCLMCSYSKNCSHIKLLQSSLTDGRIAEVPDSLFAAMDKCNNYTSHSESPVLKPITRKPIPYIATKQMQQVLCLSTLERMCASGVYDEDYPVLVPNKEGVCEKCGFTWSQESEATTAYTIPLVDKKTTSLVKVHHRKCSNTQCSAFKSYDGQEECFFHMNKVVLAYEVLLDFMDLFSRNRTTMYGYYLALRDSHERCSDSRFPSALTSAGFRWAWYSFFTLVCETIDFPKGFTCVDCGSSPEKLIMDATSLSHRKSFATWIDFLNQGNDYVTAAILDTKSKSQRIFIKDSTTRRLLLRYAGWSGGHPLDASEHAKLMYGIDIYANALSPLLKMFLGEQLTDLAPPEYRPLLRILASSSPVCSFISQTPRCVGVLTKIIDGVEIKEYPNYLRDLAGEVPALFRLLQQLESTPQELKELVKALLKISNAPFDTDDRVMEPDVAHFDSAAGYFPTLPQIRRRHRYKQDNTKQFANKHKGEIVCEKGKGHPSLLPGIFCIFCEHGVCYGYQLMQQHESPNVPFTIMLTRFRKAPSTVIYDNSCNLHAYCLNRRPNFFRSTRFLVDRLHWHNHKGCSEGYKLDSYPQYSALNSQAAEQANSSIGRLKSMLSYMNNDNFMRHCTFYLWVLNKNKY